MILLNSRYSRSNTQIELPISESTVAVRGSVGSNNLGAPNLEEDQFRTSSEFHSLSICLACCSLAGFHEGSSVSPNKLAWPPPVNAARLVDSSIRRCSISVSRCSQLGQSKGSPTRSMWSRNGRAACSSLHTADRPSLLMRDLIFSATQRVSIASAAAYITCSSERVPVSV